MAAFLDNTNDIILDAVLTDYGRQLLAKGDGSFNVTKFAFGDDEIDYSLYNASAASPNQDTEIMSTIVLEAFTNNAASMKSKLLTIADNNLLFLPVLALNNLGGTAGTPATTDLAVGQDYFIVPVNASNTLDTTNSLTGATANSYIQGVLVDNKSIIVDQGLSSNKTDKTLSLKNSPLYETEYNIKIDSRLGIINGTGVAFVSVDDDLIATYKITDGATGTANFIQIPTNSNESTPLGGTKGSRVFFTVSPSESLRSTNTLFNRLGSDGAVLNSWQSTKLFRTIRTTIQVEAVTTGYILQIPVVFAKVQ